MILPGNPGEPYLEFYLIGLAERPELSEPSRDLTRMSIQTVLTRRSIHTEIRRKKKNEEKEKVRKFF